MEDSDNAVLVTSSEATQSRLLPVLESLNLRVLPASCVREARKLFSQGVLVRIVVTEVSLPDGNWCDVVRFAVDCPGSPELLVAVPSAGVPVRREALWRGVNNFLQLEATPSEARTIVQNALRDARRRVAKSSAEAA